jgi:DNA-binding transcriptional MocR family regulator
LRLSCSDRTTEEIETGMARLAAFVREECQRTENQ